jgi:hypothetical protein
MDNLIQRLRDPTATTEREYYTLCLEAADELERLTRERDEARAKVIWRDDALEQRDRLRARLQNYAGQDVIPGCDCESCDAINEAREALARGADLDKMVEASEEVGGYDSLPSNEQFCRSCGASIPHRRGEGRCEKCVEHDPVWAKREIERLQRERDEAKETLREWMEGCAPQSAPFIAAERDRLQRELDEVLAKTHDGTLWQPAYMLLMEERDRLRAALERIDKEDPSPTQMEQWILWAKRIAREARAGEKHD